MKLTSQASRIALILHMIDTMQGVSAAPVTVTDLKNLAATEVTKRPRVRRCTVESMEFPSTISAASYLAHHRRDLWVNSKAAARQDAHAVMENLRNRVKRLCNADNVHGYYWGHESDQQAGANAVL